jgi:hypothetical protein
MLSHATSRALDAAAAVAARVVAVHQQHWFLRHACGSVGGSPADVKMWLLLLLLLLLL